MLLSQMNIPILPGCTNSKMGTTSRVWSTTFSPVHHPSPFFPRSMWVKELQPPPASLNLLFRVKVTSGCFSSQNFSNSGTCSAGISKRGTGR